MAKYDLYVVPKDPAHVVGMEIFDFGGARTSGVSGFYKTILQWLKCFLTERGSETSDPEYGTELGARLGMLNNSELEVRDIIHSSMEAATETIQRYQSETANLTSEDLLLSADFTKLKLAYDSADVYIVFKNAAGTLLTLNLPVGLRAPLPSP